MNYADIDADNRVRQLLSDEIDTIPATAIPVTPAQVGEWNASRKPLKLVDGAFVVDDEEVRRQDGRKLLTRFDREIEKADLRAVLLQVSWLLAQVLPQVDISALPAQRQTRINNIIGRLDKLSATHRARKQAETDLASGADPATITIPPVDSLDV